jgi:hypothetical protein
MSRGLTSGQLTAAAQSHRVNVALVEMLFDSGTLRLAMGPWPVTVGADTYVATGAALRIDPLTEKDGGLEGLRFSMSGADPAIMDLATVEDYRGRIVRFLKARLNATSHAIIDSPTVEWIGRMRDMPINETNGSCQIDLLAEHYDIALSRPAPRRWNDSDQQRDFPGDKACEYASTMTEKFLPFPAKEALKK